MKSRNTKDRIRDRQEFVYMYRSEIKRFADVPGYKFSSEACVWADTFVRKRLPYSPGTATVDILISMTKTLNHLVDEPRNTISFF